MNHYDLNGRFHAFKISMLLSNQMKADNLAPLSDSDEPNEELRDAFNQLQKSALRNSKDDSEDAAMTIEKCVAAKIVDKFFPQLLHEARDRGATETEMNVIAQKMLNEKAKRLASLTQTSDVDEAFRQLISTSARDMYFRPFIAFTTSYGDQANSLYVFDTLSERLEKLNNPAFTDHFYMHNTI